MAIDGVDKVHVLGTVPNRFESFLAPTGLKGWVFWKPFGTVPDRLQLFEGTAQNRSEPFLARHKK